MRQVALGISAFLLAVVASADGVSAQEAAAATVENPPAPHERLSYDEYRRNELVYLSKRSRVGLISASAVTAVGVALVAPALVKECVRITAATGVDDFRCTTRGQALLAVGYPLLIGGAIGILVTGIMLGVRKGKIRFLEDRIAYEKPRSIRWDPTRSALVF